MYKAHNSSDTAMSNGRRSR